MNAIPQTQNETRQLERLAAQRALYSRAKMVQAWHIVVSVPAVIAWSFLVVAFPSWSVYAALWGIGVTLLEIVVFSEWEKSLKEEAAKIQELFDCDVLELPWHELKAGRKPELETVSAGAARYLRKHSGFDGLRDWYPEAVGALPIDLGRVLCQRSSCWWDGTQRRRYATIAGFGVGGIVLMVLLLSLGTTVEQFVLAGLAPAMPLVSLGVRHYRDHREAALRADRLKEYANDLWSKGEKGEVSPEHLAGESRVLQDQIFAHRRESPLSFDWLYSWFRAENEELMRAAVGELVRQASRRGSGARAGGSP